MHSEPVAPGGNGPYQALNWPSWAFAASPANLAAPGSGQLHQYPAEGADAPDRQVIRQPR